MSRFCPSRHTRALHSFAGQRTTYRGTCPSKFSALRSIRAGQTVDTRTESLTRSALRAVRRPAARGRIFLFFPPLKRRATTNRPLRGLEGNGVSRFVRRPRLIPKRKSRLTRHGNGVDPSRACGSPRFASAVRDGTWVELPAAVWQRAHSRDPSTSTPTAQKRRAWGPRTCVQFALLPSGGAQDDMGLRVIFARP